MVYLKAQIAQRYNVFSIEYNVTIDDIIEVQNH